MHLISQFYNSQFRIYKRISFLIMIIRGCSTTFHLCVYQVNIPIQFQFFFTSAVLSFEVKFLVEGFHFLLMKGLLLFFKNKNIFGCFCSYHQVSINYHFFIDSFQFTRWNYQLRREFKWLNRLYVYKIHTYILIIVNAIILSLVPISIGDPVMVQKKPTNLTVLKTLKIVGLLVKQCFSLQYISWN